MATEGNKTVFIIHTSLALVDVLGKLFKEQLPGVRIVNLVDDSLLADVRAAGHVIPSVARRMVGYATLAESSGADALFNACSSVGEVADMIRQVVNIPVIKIDESMAEEAVARGKNIAVAATVQTTLDPTLRMIQRKAQERGKEVTVQPYLVEGAFDKLMCGLPADHDEMVLGAVRKAAREADVVVLAQGSMARLEPQLADLKIPVLTSPSRGIAQLKQVLG